MAEVQDLMERVRSSALPPSDQAFMASARPETYLAARRRFLEGIIGNDSLTLTEKIDTVLDSEPPRSLELQRHEYADARHKAAAALLGDTALNDFERFDLLAEIETGRRSPRIGFHNYEDAFAFLKDRIREGGGKVLQLVFTERDGSDIFRKFVRAVPHDIDLDRPDYFVLRPSQLPNRLDPYRMPSFVTPESGYYLRYSPAAQEWYEAAGQKQQGVLVSTVDDPEAGYENWQKYKSWSCSSYPDRGDGVLFGVDDAREFIERMMTFGGVCLGKIQEDVADYPGFEFVHDIKATGTPGADSHDLASELSTQAN